MGEETGSARVVTLQDLLDLILKNGGPKGLDLRGASFRQTLQPDEYITNFINLSPDALAPILQEFKLNNLNVDPPWLGLSGGINLEHSDLTLYVARQSSER